ncbi:MAG: alkaline phosphatase [Bacteroidales bacterium]
MKSFILLFLIVLCPVFSFFAQNHNIKNVILMIPDGTSSGLLSMSRWYQRYLDSTQTTLYLDPYLCGMVRSCSSNAPIGDSAPTTSCYVTGQPSQTGFVATYPVKTDHDLFPIDATRAYQPMATILEAARIVKNKATGLVFTCEFPHATPADCSAHYYNRENYEVLAPQMVHNNIDVVIGGGTKFLTPELQTYLQNNDYQIILQNKKALDECNNPKFWALFESYDMPYDLERDTVQYPSLSQMTQKAIETLSKNPNGFFLMVEGSKIDWAAHNDDAKTAIIEFLAFDKAVKTAIDFAKKEGHTVVVILPDHGTSGMNIGNANSNKGYDTLSLQQIMNPIKNISLSSYTMAKKMNEQPVEDINALFQQYYQIDLTPKEIDLLYTAKNFKNSPLPENERSQNLKLPNLISQVLYNRTYIGFTTFGHTGEDVFLAVYHPNHDIPNGVKTNIEINQYLCRQMGIEKQLASLTEELFTDHHQLFPEAKEIKIDSLGKNHYQLTVTNKKHTLVAESYTNFILLDNKKIELPSVIVYIDKNQTFYLPRKISEMMK